jgi:hypothetical protein
MTLGERIEIETIGAGAAAPHVLPLFTCHDMQGPRRDRCATRLALPARSNVAKQS